MYFKKLELIGFKSFAEKTKLHFEAGVTAIVGPNGTGKSNLADAIKWAFGEQSSKSLRASRMEDVIFNGTDQKEPINLAEVSITLSNESKTLPIEYDEVTISRRLFRSGESEYLLNKMPVRLKDIQELLMGTGIGTESYSLIEQGQIDLILSSKPEDRRYIFEEASGITKYKSKKKEALSKLEQTENNSIRINDIINEVKRQISSIERQAKKAEKYKQEFEKLKELDTKFSLFNYRNLKNEEKIKFVEIADIRHKEKELAARIMHLTEIIETLKANLEDVSEKFFSLQVILAETISTIDKNSHKVSLNQERIKELEQSRILLNEEIQKAQARHKSFEESLKVLKRRIDEFTNEKNAKEALVSQEEKEYQDLSKQIDTHHKDIADSKTQTVENLARQSRLNNELTRLSADIQNRSTRLRRLAIEKDKVKEEQSSIEKEFGQVDSEMKEVGKALDDLNKKGLNRQKDLSSHKDKANSLNEELANYHKDVSLLKSRLQFLEELIKNYEGFDKAVKSILEAKKKGMFPRVYGPICNIIDITEKLQPCLEVALACDTQSFIVKSSQDAEELFSYLKNNNLGRATVIITDDLPRIGPTKSMEKFSLKTLSDAVKLKDEYKQALAYLLKDIYVAQNKEDAFGVINKLGPGTKIVTNSGQLIQRGRISSGAEKRSSDVSLLGRERKIEQMQVDIETHNNKIAELNENIKNEEVVVRSIEKELISISGQIRAEEIKLANINARKETIETQLNRLKDEELVLNTEMEELNEFVGELHTREENLKKSIKEVEEEKLYLENVFVESQTAIDKKSKQKEELLVEVTQYRTELTSMSREERSLLENLTREESAYKEICYNIETKQKQIIDGDQRIKECHQENRLLESEDARCTSNKAKFQKDIESIREEKSQLTSKIAEEDKKIQSEKSSLEQLRQDLHELDMKRTELSYRQNSLKEKVLQAYKVDLDQLQITLDEGANWEEIQSQIEELKAKLEKMGTVNLVAIEEHQELQERFNFLTHQQQDLLNAKDSLMKAIQKINRTTRSLFIDTFTKIQAEFRSFFRLLFGGGQAELLLLDERDILESGIEIIVRPPGKKLQNISLLSGGEKALTAIALLFAIFKVKPSPFCVLDEIDAALDESNIGRFSNVLKDFIKNSQFIIITHNKKTIELADVMYGITMEESGVSRIVSVKFADAEKEKQKAEILT